MNSRPSIHDERGIGLVIALLVLLVLSLLAVVLMTSVNIETKISGNGVREARALNTAEAGIGEAIARIGEGLGPDPNAANAAQKVTQVFLANAGSVPALGADSTALATAQPAGAWLNYSTATRGPRVLTIEFKTDPARTVVYRYDSAKNPAVNTVSGFPIYKITSTGVVGPDSRRVVTEMIMKPITLNMKGAMVTNVDIKFTGNAFACGYNHRADTPYDACSNGRAGVGGCDENPGLNHWEIGSGDLTGIWSGGAINSGGASNDAGTPSEAANQAGFYAGPWQALGMTQAAFYSWVGAPVANMPGNLNGVYYLDNDATAQNQSGAWSGGGSTGSGLLYVDGNFTMNSGFTYRGLIYVEGDVQLNGHAWILGGMIVRGKTSVKFNGGATLLYSADAIQQNIAKAKGQFVTLSWREM